ncbi:MAG TPA: hypothetical protein VFH03_16805 [Actinoplanes sp.]|nr:hypothetical protein [Actinoplanes sp.]
MTAQPTGSVPWSPDPDRQRHADLVDDADVKATDPDTGLVLESPFEIRLPIADMTP